MRARRLDLQHIASRGAVLFLQHLAVYHCALEMSSASLGTWHILAPGTQAICNACHFRRQFQQGLPSLRLLMPLNTSFAAHRRQPLLCRSFWDSRFRSDRRHHAAKKLEWYSLQGLPPGNYGMVFLLAARAQAGGCCAARHLSKHVLQVIGNIASFTAFSMVKDRASEAAWTQS